MKIFLSIICFFVSIACYAQVNSKQVYVKPYTKTNGTVVQGHYRTAPNSTNRDNFSTSPNVNPYTGKRGYIEPDNNSLYSSPTSISDAKDPSASRTSNSSYRSRGNFYLDNESSENYTNTYLYLREDGASDAKVIMTLPKGVPINVISSADDWRYISYSGNYGWVHVSGLTKEKSNIESLISFSNLYSQGAEYYTNTVMNLRQESSTNAYIILMLPKQAKVEVIETKRNWKLVNYLGYQGWVHSSGLKEKRMNIEDHQSEKSVSNMSSLVTFNPQAKYYTNTYLYLKESNDSRAHTITTIPKDVLLEVINTNENWWLVSYLGQKGWVDASGVTCRSNGYLENSPSVSTNIFSVSTKYYTNTYLYLRKNGDQYSEVIMTLPKGAFLEIINTNGDWWLVSYLEHTGWVHASGLSRYANR